MSSHVDRLLELAGAPAAPLRVVRRIVRDGGPLGPEEAAALAERLRVPPATLRGALSSFDELHASPRRVRPCGGTSCALAAGGPLRGDALGPGASPAWCLGHCDRSPAVLTAEDEVLVDARTEAGTIRGRLAAGVLPDARAEVAEPVVLRRVLGGDHSALDAARAAGAWSAFEAALAQPPSHVLDAVERSGVRGRGGAAFPTGAKWRAAASTAADRRFVVANGDEGDPGSFVDRVLLEHDPHAVLEGVALCALAIGASEAFVFIRGEYPRARRVVERAVEDATAARLLGEGILGTDVRIDVRVIAGMGSYVCGEETALIAAIAGQRPEARARPPYPAVEGLHGRPTVVNNVETLAAVPWIVSRGADAYRALGTPRSPGTKVLSLNAGFARPGLVEVELGTPFREVVERLGGGGVEPLRAVALGGPMGSVLEPAQWDVATCWGAMADRGIVLGHGGVVAIPESADLRALLEHWTRFAADESCGRCTPCAQGTRRALALVRGGGDGGDAGGLPLARVLDVMEQASLCAFGQLVPGPLRTLARMAGVGP